MERDEVIDLPPGFRFHPTDEELIMHYLSVKAKDSSFRTTAIGEADLNQVEPWELPWKAKIGEREWYFFCMKDRKYPTGLRVNRATRAGYWKATGKDKKIFQGKFFVGMKKTLVFYKGRAPRGEKTNWVMHEYRLDGMTAMRIQNTSHKNEWVICRIFKKTSGGDKVHISGLVRIPTSGDGSGSSSGTPELPSLMEMTAEPIGQHVTCFSNEMEEPLHKYSYISPVTKQKDIGYNMYDMKTVFENQELSVISTAPLDLDSLWDF